MSDTLIPTEQTQQDRGLNVHDTIRSVLGLINTVAATAIKERQQFDAPMKDAYTAVIHQIEQQFVEMPGMDDALALVRKVVGLPPKATKRKEPVDGEEQEAP